ncbi:hypothetical protein LPTSP4_13960 [Leptospira ryugenii]|uniref:Uncharacterized protein n=1 Tax=Leptospira ryugenii TaxID=1917863 RepID=A0A2P2DZ56_9LEPT|nr:hypothetical protein [Leptospira ryugenii]GBF49876.1 hypothetical protein LPTSP4_13960 [Leptospira ryugenii]
MAGTIKVALELVDSIRKQNIETKDKIPGSDTFLRVWAAQFSRTEDEIRKILYNLRESHYIFIINTVAPDPNLFVYGEEVYMIAEHEILTELKRDADTSLERIYESSNYKRKSSFQISRELFPRIKEYNNTPLGRAINLVVMLEEYLRILSSTSYEYTEQWRKQKLQELYASESTTEEISSAFSQATETKRAVDIMKESGKEKQDPSWSKATQSFTVEFLLRVHFRKYEFDIIKKLIQTGKISQEKELKFIRDTLNLMETRTNEDRILKRYMEEMIELRRYCQAKLNIMRQGSQPKQAS